MYVRKKKNHSVATSVVVVRKNHGNDSKWDGLKGYITNTELDAETVIAEYHGLWVVERAFRIKKGL